MPKNAIVVGMPRSGTSFVTSIFVNQGYFVAEDTESELQSADTYNPGGYFEASQLIEQNVEIFQRVGYPHHNSWMFDPFPAQQQEGIADLPATDSSRAFVAANNIKSPWVWKDPRMCYTLDYWWPLLDPSCTAVLLLLRDPKDIFSSFQRVGWREGTESDRIDVHARTTAHIEAARVAIARHDIPYCELAYSDFRKQSRHVLDSLRETFELSLDERDLGFRVEFDHSSGRGGVERALERIAIKIPGWMRKSLKRILPDLLLRKLFPTRY